MSTPVEPNRGDAGELGDELTTGSIADQTHPPRAEHFAAPAVAGETSTRTTSAAPAGYDTFLGRDAAPARPYGQVAADLGVDRESVTAREQERYGGVKIGSAFFGFTTAIGIAALLTTLLAGTGVAIGLANHTSAADINDQAASATGTAKTVGLVGAILLLVVLAVAYYCGGYVAGRMARFQGFRQGLAVWLWSVVFAIVVAVLVLIFGSKVNVLSQLNLPRIPVDEGSLSAAGWIALAAVIVVSLVAALLGGKAGMVFHRKVDRAGLGA